MSINEKKPTVKPVESNDSNIETSTTPVVVDQIETPEEVAKKDQDMARQIIARVVPVEGEIKLEQQALNRKKAFVGCWLLLSKRLTNSGDEDDKKDKIKEKNKVSLFDQMLAEQKLSRATAYRRMSFARACIEKGVISTETLALIEKSAVVTPDLISLLDACLSTLKGIKVQQEQGLLPGPDKPKVLTGKKSLKERLDEKSKQVEALLAEIKQLLADKELTKSIGDKSVLEKLTLGYSNLDSSFLKFKTINLDDLPTLAELPKLEPSKMPDFTIPSLIKP